jgi:two-component system, NarL family, invasion response regulator UvrY
MKKVLIADDHSIVRRGLRFLLQAHYNNLEIIEVASCSQVMDELAKQEFPLAILDLQLTDGTSMEIIPNILATYPQLRIMVYTMSSEEVYGKRLLQMGVHGFLNKQADDQEILFALGKFFEGGSYVSPTLQRLLDQEARLGRNKMNNPFSTLSNREIEVANYLLSGLSQKEISAQMDLHVNTVLTYKNRILEKLGVTNLYELNKIATLYKI